MPRRADAINDIIMSGLAWVFRETYNEQIASALTDESNWFLYEEQKPKKKKEISMEEILNKANATALVIEQMKGPVKKVKRKKAAQADEPIYGIGLMEEVQRLNEMQRAANQRPDNETLERIREISERANDQRHINRASDAWRYSGVGQRFLIDSTVPDEDNEITC